MPQQQFEALRKQYPVFSYDDYTITRVGTRVRLTFHFSVEGLCRFAPTTEIETENLNLLNDPDSPLARRVVFALGMTELVSYGGGGGGGRSRLPEARRGALRRTFR